MSSTMTEMTGTNLLIDIVSDTNTLICKWQALIRDAIALNDSSKFGIYLNKMKIQIDGMKMRESDIIDYNRKMFYQLCDKKIYLCKMEFQLTEKKAILDTLISRWDSMIIPHFETMKQQNLTSIQQDENWMKYYKEYFLVLFMLNKAKDDVQYASNIVYDIKQKLLVQEKVYNDKYAVEVERRKKIDEMESLYRLLYFQVRFSD